MLSFGPSIFVLGLFVASVTADETDAGDRYTSTILPFDENKDINSTTLAPTMDNNATWAYNNASISMDNSTVNVTNSTTIPSTTMETRTETSTIMTSIMSSPAPQTAAPETTVSTTKAKGTDKTAPALKTSGDTTGIIILVVIILVAFGFGLACYITRRRARRYSVDINSRPDEANIPLSTMDPDMPLDSAPQNGLQTFESIEIVSKEPQEAEAKEEEPKEGEPKEAEAQNTEATPDVQEEQKSEADKSAAEASSPDKPKEDVVEPSPPAPAEPSVEEKTDDEGAVSNKTSVESLKDANENNSNNSELGQQRDLKSSSVFWDVPLDCPV